MASRNSSKFKTHRSRTGGGTGCRDPIQASVIRKIHQLLPSEPSILAVAAALSMNVRTLQRKLAGSGVSYRQLLDECRRRQAEAYLRRKDLSVAEVSRRLGYSDPAHFVRAFRRWTGHVPSTSRAAHRHD